MPNLESFKSPTVKKRGGISEKTRRDFLKIAGGVSLCSGAMLSGLNVASGQATAPKDVPKDPVKIGIMAFQKGAAAVLGIAAWRACQIWRDQVNAAGGILGRKVELHLEEESSAKDTVKRFKKLTLSTKVDVISGLASTGNGQAVGPVAEQLGQLWLSHDATTQKGLEETMPKMEYGFRSVYNESEAVAGALMTAKYFPGIKTVAGINNDYSYGRTCWEAFLTVLRYLNPEIRPVEALWPKLGVTNFTSHIAALKKANPDLIMCSFWSGDTTNFMKQAAEVGLFDKIKGCFTTGGGVHYTLKKSFTPEGLIMGYNSYYFRWTDAWPLNTNFVKTYVNKYKEYPPYESDQAYFTLQAYKAAVEKCYSITDRWPKKGEIATALRGIIVPSLSGHRGYREDNYQICSFFMGITTHDNPYDFVTVKPVEMFTAAQIMHPANMKFHDWAKSWEKP
jgi:branched-chain amino acid transport system substrate-binding protein